MALITCDFFSDALELNVTIRVILPQLSCLSPDSPMRTSVHSR